MSESLVLFDSKARLRPMASFTEQELAGLTVEQRASFDEVRSLGSALEAAEAELAQAGKDIHARADDVRAAVDARNAFYGKRTALDEWRAMRSQALIDAGYDIV